MPDDSQRTASAYLVASIILVLLHIHLDVSFAGRSIATGLFALPAMHPLTIQLSQRTCMYRTLLQALLPAVNLVIILVGGFQDLYALTHPLQHTLRLTTLFILTSLLLVDVWLVYARPSTRLAVAAIWWLGNAATACCTSLGLPSSELGQHDQQVTIAVAFVATSFVASLVGSMYGHFILLEKRLLEQAAAEREAGNWRETLMSGQLEQQRRENER